MFKPFTRDQEVGPSEADIAIRDHRTQAAATVAQRRFHLCSRKHHSMKAAGYCCCCSMAVAVVAEALAIVVAAGHSAAGSCKSLGRGLEACDRESILCRGKVGIRAFCDDER